jgi:hypothetical protein
MRQSRAIKLLAISLGEDESRSHLPKMAKISNLGLSLVCANSTPVVNMPAHSPPLPLTVNYFSKDCIATDDEGGIVFALEQHDPNLLGRAIRSPCWQSLWHRASKWRRDYVERQFPKCAPPIKWCDRNVRDE